MFEPTSLSCQNAPAQKRQCIPRRRQWLAGTFNTCAALFGAALAPQAGWAVAATAQTAGSFYAQFGGMHLLDQHNRLWQPEQAIGRIVLLNFIFTGCSSTCPLQTQALADMLRRMPPALRSRVQLLSVSLDPLSDSPATLNAYARRMGVDSLNWRFITGRPQDIERLSEALVLFPPKPQPGQPAAQMRLPQARPAKGADAPPKPLLNAHSAMLWLLDERGDLRQRYDGNPPDAPRLLREITALDQLQQTPRP